MKRVFEILENDARTSPEKIATMSGESVKKVKETIKKAEKDGTILKYKTIINWAKLGTDSVLALVEVKVTPQREFGFDHIAKRIYEFPQTRSLYLVSGTYDLAVLVAGNTMQDVAAFVAEKLAPLGGVQSTVTHFFLRKYKEDGVVYENSDEVKRIAVSA
jgi:DNA-binding Lrp family transcriptional regulator